MEIINDVNGLFEFQDLGARTELKNKANLVQSKNLFDMIAYVNLLSTITNSVTKGTLNACTDNSFTITSNGADCYTNLWTSSDNNKFTIIVEPNTTYTLSWDCEGASGNVFVFSNATTTKMWQVVNSKKQLIFTTDNDTTFVTVRFGVANANQTATYSNIQIELGEVATDYVPYKIATGVKELDNKVDKLQDINKTKFTAIADEIINNSIKNTTDKSTSIVLNDSSDCNIVGLTLYGKSTQSAIPTPTNPVDINNINNPSITFSNDSDSQSINIQCTLRGIENVCDTLTVNSDGTGYITQRLFVERITSQKKPTSFEWNYSKTTHRFFRDDYSYSFDVKDNKPLILCSHLDVGENEKNTAFDNSIGWINVSGVGISIRMTEFNGDIAKFKKWLDDNEVYVVAPRSKPITVNLSKDEVDKILSLHTYYPSTTVVSDCDSQLTYVADTKHYIDNKILEVATALVAHEGEVN